jgi:phage I-like protein
MTTFKPGESGNPAGKPKGARNKTTLAVEALLEGEAETLTRKAIEIAKSGDMQALRLCLDRIAPARKDRHVPIDLPALDSAADAVKASAVIVAALSEGELSPSEASELSKLVGNYVAALTAADFEKRLALLETAAAGT